MATLAVGCGELNACRPSVPLGAWQPPDSSTTGYASGQQMTPYHAFSQGSPTSQLSVRSQVVGPPV